MKKVILLVHLCLLAFVMNVSAQAVQVKVVNNTSCDVYYTLLGDKKGSCSPAISGPFMTLAPGGSVLYNASVIPPLAAGDWINGAYVYTSMSWCPAFTAYKVGEPCTGWPASASYFVYDATTACRVCKDVMITAKWISGGTGGTATLVFN
ncbi:MAG TPA: hypothetical protein VL092_07215 [Chitinophagaceae bacterium]|nr:hypothetical protein [Chitinophagaceae bacterium]